MERALVDVSATEIKRQLTGVAALKALLEKGDIDAASEANELISALLPALKKSNHKLVQGALECLNLTVAGCTGTGLPRKFVDSVAPALVLKMGDAKAQVRQAAVDVALSIMGASTPSTAFDRLGKAATHKNWRCKEQWLVVYTRGVERFGESALPVSGVLERVLKCLEDAHPPVRDAALDALEVMHRFAGSRFAAELERRSLRPQHKRLLQERIEASGEPDATAPAASSRGAVGGAGGVDSAHGARAGEGGGRGGGERRRVPPVVIDDTSSRSSESGHRDRPNSAADAVTGFEPNGRASDRGRRVQSARGTSRGFGEVPAGGGSGRQRATTEPAGRSSSATSVKPMRVSSDRQLAKEVATIASALETSQIDWNERMDALAKLRGLVAGPAVDMDSYPSAMTKLVSPLQTQCADLRSAVARMACTAVSEIAKSLGHEFEPLAAPLVGTLLKLTVVTIAVIRESGDATLRDIVKCTRVGFAKAIPKLLMGVQKSRAAVLKTRAMEYLVLSLRWWDSNTINRYGDEIEACIKSALSDAEGDVRAWARLGYWALSVHAPERTQRLLRSMDANVQRHVFGDEDKFRAFWEAEGAEMDGIPPPRDMEPAVPAHRQHRDRERGGRSKQSSRDAAAASDHGSGAVGYEETPVVDRAVADDPHGRHGSVRAGGFDRSESKTHYPRAAQRAPAEEHRIPAEEHEVERTRKALRGGARRAPASASAAVSVAGAGGAGSAVHARSGGYGEEPPVESSAPPKPDPRDGRYAGATEVSDGGVEFAQHLGAMELLHLCESELWSTRVEAFEALSLVFRDEARGDEAAAVVERTARVLMEHLGDAHYKVVNAALHAAAALVDGFAAELEPQLEWLLPKVLLQLQSQKGSTRERSLDVLEAIKSGYHGALLAPIATRVLDIEHPRVRGGALDLLAFLLEDVEAIPYFESPTRMQQFVKRLSGFVSGKAQDLKRAATVCLVQLYSALPSQFLDAVAMLPPAAQSNLTRSMSSAVPDIHAAVAGSRTGTSEGHRRDGGRTAVDRRIGHTSAPPAPVASAPDAYHQGQREGYARRDVGADDRGGHDARHPSASHPLPVAESSAAASRDHREHLAASSHAKGSGMPTAGSDGSFDAKISAILQRLERGRDVSERRGALHEIGHQSYEGSVALKAPYFGRLLAAVMDVLRGDAEKVLQEAALAVIRRMLRHQGSMFEDYTEVLMARLLTCAASEKREVCHAADRTMDLLVSVVDPRRALQVLIPVINSEDGPAMQSAVCTLSRLVARLPLSHLNSALPAFMPGLLRGFKSPSADIRKAVVFCLVDLYMAAGDALTPHLASLNVAQLKLVTIYVNRTLKAKADKEGRAVEPPPASLAVLTASATAKSLGSG